MTSLKPYIFFIALLASIFPAIAQDYNNIEFIENKGQWDSRVKFKGEVQDHGYGFVTHFEMPGNFEVQLYQPKYKK